MAILNGAYNFSKMLHGSKASSGGGADAFYKAFVPEIGSIELVKRCVMNERGQVDRVGACVFPGLVKGEAETTQTVVRRAQVICGCALGFNH
ncbi:pentafunctional AROM polypeptide [Rhizoctonia solani]|uniref:Pentafunctional AROM polypeptide n=1 Tax=Rhizoctonia solani TaxID=456999 RepID=A0A8H8NRY2_9AGAM|nr:pentafunctional AROM polypeptide [Rhizoctonia solani]QRW17692.1 pentafunctional AROM polypeptide [Rhizoctonia solani]